MSNRSLASKNWIVTGLIWGVFMFLIMDIALPLGRGEAIDTDNLLVGGLIWFAGGLLFGFTMKHVQPPAD